MLPGVYIFGIREFKEKKKLEWNKKSINWCKNCNLEMQCHGLIKLIGSVGVSSGVWESIMEVLIVYSYACHNELVETQFSLYTNSLWWLYPCWTHKKELWLPSLELLVELQGKIISDW